ncbi:hypothetical protein GGX14DRAFT_392231 [Mycena pura]|uniref:Uncharacterized protein n=1 Tax=Mycena pura TaxID=153505 RepID=A0AAD6YJC7_9AGAR|nr:hypothetical protein GGX14DRAFT_392231 [Mycena pura]
MQSSAAAVRLVAAAICGTCNGKAALSPCPAEVYDECSGAANSERKGLQQNNATVVSRCDPERCLLIANGNIYAGENIFEKNILSLREAIQFERSITSLVVQSSGDDIASNFIRQILNMHPGNNSVTIGRFELVYYLRRVKGCESEKCMQWFPAKRIDVPFTVPVPLLYNS